jgi:methylenetetrahydrofolate dehydrogenase (NADP+)/methenyltetrahydrofolate cyclohydrolase
MAEAQRLSGTEFAKGLRARLTEQVADLKAQHGLTPGLAVVLVGSDAASEVYVRSKGKLTQEAGMNSWTYKLPEETTQEELLAKVTELNADPAVHGILVQLPLPDHLDERPIIAAIDPAKDVDGLTNINAGLLLSGGDGLFPCTPVGCMMLIRDVLGDDLSGKRAIVIGRSNLVGKPVAQLLTRKNATVTTAHSRTDDLPGECRRADIIIAAVGVPEMVRGNWVKHGALVIDVGINRVPDTREGAEEGKTRLVGDVCYAEAAEKADAITPVPGGVGPMTIACLLHNTITAACRQAGVERPAD